MNLAKETAEALVALQSSPNEWHARHARRILAGARAQRRGEPECSTNCVRKTRGESAIQLRILLAQHAVGGLRDPAAIERALADPDPAIRAWTIQLATEQGPPAAPVLAKFAELARSDPSPLVRLYLASAMQRLPLEERWDTLAALVGHGEDASDHNLPLMYWYAAEPLAGVDAARAAALAASSPLSRLQEFMARRIAALGTPESLALLVGELGRAADSARRLTILIGIEEALRGRRQVAMPAAWPDVFKILGSDPDADVRSRAVALGVNFGDPAARDSLRRVLADQRPSSADRRQALAALLKVKDPPLARVLHEPGASPASSAARPYAACRPTTTPPRPKS